MNPPNTGGANAKPAKRSYVRGPKPLVACAVCGAKASKFKYYNVLSCDGCKQFFRRAVSGQRHYFCRQDAQCNSINDTKCRSCRLDWCLFKGMDYKLVLVEQTPGTPEFFEALEERKKRALQKFQDHIDKQSEEHFPLQLEDQGASNQSVNAVPDPMMDKHLEMQRTLHSLAVYETKLGRFNEEIRVLDDRILGQFGSLEELLLSTNSSVVDNFEGVSKAWPRMPLHRYESYAASKNMKPPKNYNALINECIAVVDLFRSMPFFAQLDIKYKTRLVSYTGMNLVGLHQRHHSAKLNSELVITPGALFSPYPFYRRENDPNVCSLARQLYLQSMYKFNQLKLGTEEFLLLRAIVLAHSAVSGLSPQGQDLLQREAERYARILMHYLQTNYGHFGGAKRYADILALAENLFHTGSRHRAFFTYLDTVYDQGRFRNAMPPVILPMLLGD